MQLHGPERWLSGEECSLCGETAWQREAPLRAAPCFPPGAYFGRHRVGCVCAAALKTFGVFQTQWTPDHILKAIRVVGNIKKKFPQQQEPTVQEYSTNHIARKNVAFLFAAQPQGSLFPLSSQ